MLRTSEKSLSSRRVLFRFSLFSVARGIVKDILINLCSSFVTSFRSRLLAHSQSPNRPLGWEKACLEITNSPNFQLVLLPSRIPFMSVYWPSFLSRDPLFCRETLFFVAAVANFVCWSDPMDMNETKRQGVGQGCPLGMSMRLKYKWLGENVE